jgi:ADP-ribose pyrophosphatase YjhB (NUDIX family)
MTELTRDFVASVFIVHEGKVLLVHHKKMGMWLPPGGHIDGIELPAECAVREAKEETGLDIEIVGKDEHFDRVVVMAHPKAVQLEDIEPGHQHIDLIYFAKLKDPSQELKLNAEESNELKWFARDELDEVPELVALQAKKAIDELK